MPSKYQIIVAMAASEAQSTMTVIKYLCEKRNIVCEVVSCKQPIELSAAIKRGFSKVHIYLTSDNEEDIASVRTNYQKWKQI